MIAREREAPAERVQQVGDHLLAHDEHDPPTDPEHGQPHRIGPPHEDGHAEETEERQDYPAAERHLGRLARTQPQRLNQKTFAPRAATHRNHSRRPITVKASTT